MKFDSLVFEIVVIAGTVWQTFMRNAEGNTGNTARSWFNLPSV